MNVNVRPLAHTDIPWAEDLMGATLGGREQARLGVVIDALACPGLVAEAAGDRAGLVTYEKSARSVEVVYIETVVRRAGVGTALLDALASQTAARRLWLVTTNDNLDSLRFYQRRGFRITEVRTGAVDQARQTLKPSIPWVGSYGIPIRDEILLERTAQ